MVSTQRKCLNCGKKYNPVKVGRKMCEGYEFCPNCSSRSTTRVKECEKNETLIDFKN